MPLQPYQHILKPLLFRLNPEHAHNLTLKTLQHISQSPTLLDLLRQLNPTPPLPITTLNHTFPNPIGIPAGLDKNAQAIPALEALGFGFTEIGSITPHPQTGNPKPRLHRIPQTQALINHMGINNHGAKAIHKKLKQKTNPPRKTPLLINIAQNNQTPPHNAHHDLTQTLTTLWQHADLITINLSCPNNPNNPHPQNQPHLPTTLTALNQQNQQLAQQHQQKPKPILLKISPDLTTNQLNQLIQTAQQHQITAIIATNTTTQRPHPTNQPTPTNYKNKGGLSGKPLHQKSTQTIRHIHQQTNGKLPTIGVGGIHNPQTAWEKITAGAHLLQIYTALIYHGPQLIPHILHNLIQQLHTHKLHNLQQAIGTNLPYIQEKPKPQTKKKSPPTLADRDKINLTNHPY